MQKRAKMTQKRSKVMKFCAINGKFSTFVTTWRKFELLRYKLYQKYKNVQFGVKINRAVAMIMNRSRCMSNAKRVMEEYEVNIILRIYRTYCTVAL